MSPPPPRCQYYYCCVYLKVAMVGVSSSPLTSGTFESFWTNTSHFDFVAAHTFPSPNGESGMNVGFDFVTLPDGTWYLFHREYVHPVSDCPTYIAVLVCAFCGSCST